MERECHELDLELARHTTGKAGERAGFLTYSTIVHYYISAFDIDDGPFCQALDSALETRPIMEALSRATMLTNACRFKLTEMAYSTTHV